MFRSILPAAIVVLALADALIHLSLDIFFFHGQLFSGLLNVLFLLNFGDYVVLASGFVVSHRFSTKFCRVVSLALLAYTTATVFAWLGAGQDDLLGLGYVSKAVEVSLIFALVLQLTTLRDAPARPALVLVPHRAAPETPIDAQHASRSMGRRAMWFPSDQWIRLRASTAISLI